MKVEKRLAMERVLPRREREYYYFNKSQALPTALLDSHVSLRNAASVGDGGSKGRREVEIRSQKGQAIVREAQRQIIKIALEEGKTTQDCTPIWTYTLAINLRGQTSWQIGSEVVRRRVVG
jgi:hypothetical protein